MVFSLSSIFGMALDEAHPNKLVDKNPTVSQPYLDLKTKQIAQFVISKYYQPHPNVFDSRETLDQHQLRIMVLLLQQSRQTLMFTVHASHHFIYLSQKIITPRQATHM